MAEMLFHLDDEPGAGRGDASNSRSTASSRMKGLLGFSSPWPITPLGKRGLGNLSDGSGVSPGECATRPRQQLSNLSSQAMREAADEAYDPNAGEDEKGESGLGDLDSSSRPSPRLSGGAEAVTQHFMRGLPKPRLNSSQPAASRPGPPAAFSSAQQRALKARQGGAAKGATVKAEPSAAAPSASPADAMAAQIQKLEAVLADAPARVKQRLAEKPIKWELSEEQERVLGQILEGDSVPPAAARRPHRAPPPPAVASDQPRVRG